MNCARCRSHTKDGARDNAQGSLATDKQLLQVIAGIVFPEPRQTVIDAAIGQNGLEPEAERALARARSRSDGRLLRDASPDCLRRGVEESLEALGIDSKEAHRRIERLLREFGLFDLRHQRAETLSGGERRRLEIARALAIDPTFILLDEPFAGIDPIAVLDLQRIIRHLKSLGIGVLITDHNVRETLKITDRAYIIKDGKIFATGDPVDLSENPDVRRIYLGEDFRL